MTDPQPFVERLRAAAQKNRSWLCVGLDVVLDRLPAGLPHTSDGACQFVSAVIEATSDLVCAYKPNFAFYEAMGVDGWRMLCEMRQMIPQEIVLIADAKRGDIGSTSEAYAQAIFDRMGFDALTVNPYLGRDAIQPFLDRRDRGVIVVTRTSNPGARDFQDLLVGAEPLYLAVTRQVMAWNEHGNCGLVAGATYPAELASIRQIAPTLPILIPGVGAQAGDLAAAVKAGRDNNRAMAIVNASRSVIYAGDGPDYAQEVRRAASRLRDEINAALASD